MIKHLWNVSKSALASQSFLFLFSLFNFIFFKYDNINGQYGHPYTLYFSTHRNNPGL